MKNRGTPQARGSLYSAVLNFKLEKNQENSSIKRCNSNLGVYISIRTENSILGFPLTICNATACSVQYFCMQSDDIPGLGHAYD
jgi:hypothetical protein